VRVADHAERGADDRNDDDADGDGGADDHRRLDAGERIGGLITVTNNGDVQDLLIRNNSGAAECRRCRRG